MSFQESLAGLCTRTVRKFSEEQVKDRSYCCDVCGFHPDEHAQAQINSASKYLQASILAIV